MNQPTPRVVRLREHALLHSRPAGCFGERGELLRCRGWLEHRGASSNIVRRARTKAAMLRHAQPAIDPGELIAGKPDPSPLTTDEQVPVPTQDPVPVYASTVMSASFPFQPIDTEFRSMALVKLNSTES